ncbi:MAG: hypothetical protein HY698_06505 [Deltaproteobacteria bacterium]|nr:hypothetical protein [Deltaproteobacteria bacterium]
MRGTLATSAAVRGDTHLFEVKYDGYRALAGITAERVALQSRNGLDLSRRFPAVADALAELDVAEAVLDGEIIAVSGGGRVEFEELAAHAASLRFAVFDLLWINGTDLRTQPIEVRRAFLERVLASPPPLIFLAERLEGPIGHALDEARKRGLEGIMAKRRESRYEPGKSRAWLKVKLVATSDLAIVGYTPISTGGPAVGALLVAIYEQGAFRYAGKVGTGYSDEVRRRLWDVLEQDRMERPVAADAPRLRDARWVRPRLVAEVAFTEWTRDGKLRHPSFHGLRFDKSPEECVREIV